MNRIVRHHVPVSELPESLREGLDPGALATVEVTVETAAAAEEAPMTLEEILAFEQENFRSLDEVDAHVRALREERAHPSLEDYLRAVDRAPAPDLAPEEVAHRAALFGRFFGAAADGRTTVRDAVTRIRELRDDRRKDATP